MVTANTSLRRAPRRSQRGLTLVEFMVSITIGLLLVAAVATLIASQSSNRAEVDRAGRLIENGRYGIRALTDDLQMAGYWGELSGVPSAAALAALPDPCSLDIAVLEAASQLHVQGYNAPAVGAVSCIGTQRLGTDILVVRRADTDPIAAGTFKPGLPYIQTGLNSAATFMSFVRLAIDATSGHPDFNLVKKDKTPANARKMVTRIYYVANCSVEVGGSCAGADGGNPIPTLKMRELTVKVIGGVPQTAWDAPVTIAEGIENMQIDYGVDTNADGAPDGDDVNGDLLTAATWGNVMSVKIHLLARSLERSPDFSDNKTYPLGTAGTITPATADLGYKRHVFVQTVRLVNPSARRSS